MLPALHLLLVVMVFAVLGLLVLPGAVYLLVSLSLACLHCSDDDDFVSDVETPLLTNYT